MYNFICYYIHYVKQKRNNKLTIVGNVYERDAIYKLGKGVTIFRTFS